ncbi:MAG: hypothetical protein ACO1N0_11060 [Fluviicola sp.]
MKYLLLILTVIFTVSPNLFGQTVRPKIARIVKGIAKDNVLKSEGVGYAGVRTKQWDRFVALEGKATDEELISLTDHENEVVRCYSFHALVGRNTADLLPIVLKHLSDTMKVNIFYGCIKSRKMVGDYFLDLVTPQHADLKAYELTETEKEKVDSILIFDKGIVLSAKSQVLWKLKPEPEYYDRIREIVTDEKNNQAIVTLSRYQKQQDKKLIIERLTSTETTLQRYGVEAVKFFPDSIFFSYLKEIHLIEIKKPTGFSHSLIISLYKAIVKYKDLQSRELLELTLSSSTERALAFHSEYIWLALELYPDSIYDGIQERIQLSDSKRKELQYSIKSEYR